MALAAIVLTAGAGSIYWWQYVRNQLPAGIVWGNGRLEADEIDIDTKFAGRVSELLAQEGDMVQAGQVVARMDVKDLEATLKRGEAQAQQAAMALLLVLIPSILTAVAIVREKELGSIINFYVTR